MDTTKISWCDRVWNPVTGCSPISEGCQNCYARRMANRLKGRYGYPTDEPFRPTFHPDRLDEPLHWKKPSRIFVCSMGDLFHERINDSIVDKIMRIIWQADQHIFLLLTKRPQNLTYYEIGLEKHLCELPTNLWLGVSISTNKDLWMVETLLQIPAAKRFISCEPLLGPINLGKLSDPNISWIIVGGESGPKARPMNPDWARSLRDQCQAADVPFFFKQMSGKQPIPKDLMIREFPNMCPHNGPKMTHTNSEVECLNCNQIIGKGRE